ncbi:hypothetical protein RJ640_001432 [Escallonia rubra]|uniref:F-box associated beta-propeller type 1 domain-containing protein n=1 Tax=Escallonia rubra TaxID=112253 RepID=A0AA88UQ06_9ASTE|nr:hypothetical protein RJ640_001432 [Escallonia rubra]
MSGDGIVKLCQELVATSTRMDLAITQQCIRQNDDGESILSFHISTEVFQQIQLPDACAFPEATDRAILVLNESIALFVFNTLEQTSFDIWLMNEYGVAESWTKYLTIGPLVQEVRPVVFWKHELLMENANGQLVSCDLKSQRLKEFQHDYHDLVMKCIVQFFVTKLQPIVIIMDRTQATLPPHLEEYQRLRLLIQHQRSWMIKRGIVIVDSAEQRRNGSCPLMPEEVRSCASQRL